MGSTKDILVAMLCKLLLLSAVECILNKPGDSKLISKPHDSTKKSDHLDAQASHSHGVYGGFGENSLGGFGSNFGGSPNFGGGANFGGGGLGGYGDIGYGGFEEHDHHRHHDHHHDHHDHHHDHHDHHDGGLHKALAIKGLLVPLAGVALLGAAAAFVSNPILLQLGVISGTYGRRRRRDAERNEDLDESAARLDAQSKLNEIQILERFMAQVPKEEMFSQEKKLMANYLSCTGMEEENACHERLSCELNSPGSKNMTQETEIMSIVTQEIFNNELVPWKIKERLSSAVRLGQESGDCSVYRCKDLENLIKQKGE